MVANVLTKALPSPKVKHFAKELGLVSVWGGVLEMSWQPVPSPCAHFHLFYLPFHIPPHNTCPSWSLLLAETTIPTIFYLYSMHLLRLPLVICLPNHRGELITLSTFPLLIQYLAVLYLGTSIHQSFAYQTAEVYHIYISTISTLHTQYWLDNSCINFKDMLKQKKKVICHLKQ